VNAAHQRSDAPEGGENTVSARNGDRRVTELMSWSILTVPATMSCQEARALAAARAVHHIPVLDGGVMVGILCTCDLRGAPDDEPIERRMRHPVVTISASASSNEALATMEREDVGALPVLYHGFLIGIVTTGDLVRARVVSEAERPVCRACGTHHHVRSVEGGAHLCLSCRERRTR
jgi:CBS-domain-containing membrane protein